jgi:hypothetical protein
MGVKYKGANGKHLRLGPSLKARKARKPPPEDDIQKKIWTLPQLGRLGRPGSA